MLETNMIKVRSNVIRSLNIYGFYDEAELIVIPPGQIDPNKDLTPIPSWTIYLINPEDRIAVYEESTETTL